MGAQWRAQNIFYAMFMQSVYCGRRILCAFKNMWFYTLRRVNVSRIVVVYRTYFRCWLVHRKYCCCCGGEFTDHGAGTQLFALPVPGPQYLQTWDHHSMAIKTISPISITTDSFVNIPSLLALDPVFLQCFYNVMATQWKISPKKKWKTMASSLKHPSHRQRSRASV